MDRPTGRLRAVTVGNELFMVLTVQWSEDQYTVYARGGKDQSFKRAYGFDTGIDIKEITGFGMEAFLEVLPGV